MGLQKALLAQLLLHNPILDAHPARSRATPDQEQEMLRWASHGLTRVRHVLHDTGTSVLAREAQARPTRLVQQQQHHALLWQPSEERDPADHQAQPGEVKDAETGFSDTVPTRLTKCGRLDSNWHWNPCSYPSSP